MFLTRDHLKFQDPIKKVLSRVVEKPFTFTPNQR